MALRRERPQVTQFYSWARLSFPRRLSRPVRAWRAWLDKHRRTMCDRRASKLSAHSVWSVGRCSRLGLRCMHGGRLLLTHERTYIAILPPRQACFLLQYCTTSPYEVHRGSRSLQSREWHEKKATSVRRLSDLLKTTDGSPRTAVPARFQIARNALRRSCAARDATDPGLGLLVFCLVFDSREIDPRRFNPNTEKTRNPPGILLSRPWTYLTLG